MHTDTPVKMHQPANTIIHILPYVLLKSKEAGLYVCLLLGTCPSLLASCSTWHIMRTLPVACSLCTQRVHLLL
jgi:hypothetical protein